MLRRLGCGVQVGARRWLAIWSWWVRGGGGCTHVAYELPVGLPRARHAVMPVTKPAGGLPCAFRPSYLNQKASGPDGQPAGKNHSLAAYWRRPSA
jgi:hypothetical protein